MSSLEYKNILCIKMIGDATYDIFIIQNGEILAITQNESSRKESSEVLDVIDKLLIETGLELGQIELIAVMHGRGSFTSNRLAAVTGNTLASVLNIPIIGVQVGKNDSSEPKDFKAEIFESLKEKRPEVKKYLNPGYSK